MNDRVEKPATTREWQAKPPAPPGLGLLVVGQAVPPADRSGFHEIPRAEGSLKQAISQREAPKELLP